ncbi:MAG: hypothetical protein OXF44_05675 [Anaerolineaceae bacterium]|nr:hypothetical protein [Anaerolineaceae bacterium]
MDAGTGLNPSGMRVEGLLRRARLLPLLLLIALPGGLLAQQANVLDHFRPVTGQLAAGDARDWHFDARAGSMLSLSAYAVTGGIDPRLDIFDVNDVLVASNDDVNWPLSRNAVIEAFSPAANGSYRVRISNVGRAAGTYELVLQEGWSTLAWQADFANASAWETRPDSVDSFLGEGRAVLSLEPPATNAVLVRELQLPGDAWALHVPVNEVAGNRGWRVGIVTHWQSVRDWARFMVDDQGRWQYLINTPDGIRVLRGLAPHAAIQPGEKPESLGQVFYGDAIEFFFNRKSLGRIVDGLPSGPGRTGLYAATGSPDGGQVSAWFGGLKLTVPAQTHAGAIVPDWLPGTERALILRQLRRHRLVPAIGALAMNVPESFVISNRAGVSTLRLGGETSFARFALGSVVEAQTGSGDGIAGCGLVLETQGAETYTLAWLDNSGSAGLSRRNVDAFAPGPLRADLLPGDSADHLLVIADGENLYFYANHQYVGAQPVALPSGTIGIAAVSFDNMMTTCNFRDTWIWGWPTDSVN